MPAAPLVLADADLPPVLHGMVSRATSTRTHTLMGVQIIGCASYVPDRVVTNDDLQKALGFDPEWIRQRTGILARRHAPPEQATSDLCIEAARRALEVSRVDPADVDLVIVGTFTPDYSTPSTACLVQDRLGLNAAAFDLSAACSAFMYGLVTGAQFIVNGTSRRALVIGADCMSRIVDPSDQRTYPLFGDGAGAVVLAPGSPTQGLISYQTGSDGAGSVLLDRKGCGSRFPPTAEVLAEGMQFLQMDGRNVFKWAVRVVEETIRLLLRRTGLTIDDIHLFVLHQANIRIIDKACEQLGIPREKVFVNLDKYGNTSGGSIPIALDEAQQAGRIRPGDLLLMCGFGAGLTWGTALFRW